MTSKPFALLMAELGVIQSHSRPHVSNDNPYSDAQFKTLKYRPGFPAWFPSIEAAWANPEAYGRPCEPNSVLRRQIRPQHVTVTDKAAGCCAFSDGREIAQYPHQQAATMMFSVGWLPCG